MKKLLLAAVLASASLASPAYATGAVMAVGSSSARLCYQAAEARVVSETAAAQCDRALRDEALTQRDITATHVNRGIIRFLDGKHDAALVDFNTALAHDPNQAEAYLNKAIVMLRQPGTAAESLPLFTAAIEKNTKKPALAHLGRGMAYELSGNINAAYRDYKQANLLAPDWSAPVDELGRFQVVRN